MSVTSVTPVGAEPHDFEPSPQQLAAVQNAAVFVYIGGSFEPWADSASVGATTKRLQIALDAALPKAELEHEDSGDHADHAEDSHFWLDPALVAEQVIPQIARVLSEADPANAGYYAAQQSMYKERLLDLDRQFTEGLRTCERRTIVTAHDAFQFLAQRYNLKVLPIAGLSPEQEPDAATLAAISRTVDETGITTIFFETLTSPRLADTIAQQTGAQTAVLDPLEGVTTNESDRVSDYISIQQKNLQSLRTALACQ